MASSIARRFGDTAEKRLVLPRCDRAGGTRSRRSGGFDPLTSVIHSHQDILDWIVSPRMGHEVTVRNVSGGQERHHPLQVAIPQFGAVRH